MWYCKMSLLLSWCFFALILGGCKKGGNMEFSIPLPANFETSSLIVQEDTFLLSGYYAHPVQQRINVNDWMSQNEAEIYLKSGTGDSWQRVLSLKSGDAFYLHQTDQGKIIHCLVRFYSKSGERTTSLFRSEDAGKTWTKLPKLPTKFIGVVFTSGQKGYGWDGKSLYFTIDKGITWKSILFYDEDRDLSDTVMQINDAVYFYALGSLVKATGDNITLEQLPSHLNVTHLAMDESDNLIMVSRDSKNIVTISIKAKDGSIKQVAQLGIFLPIKLFHKRGTTLLVASRLENHVPSKFYMVSKDNGLTWKEISSNTKRPYYLNNSTVWGVGIDKCLKGYREPEGT